MLFRSRSGAAPRFLIFAGPYDSLIGKLLPNAAFYGLFLAAVVLLAALGGKEMVSLSRPDHPIRALNRPVTVQEARAGIVRTTGRVVARQRSDIPPICVVVHQWYQSGKNGGWREDWRQVVGRGADFITSDGKKLTLFTESISFAPQELVSSKHTPEYNRLRDFGTGRFLEQCIDDGEKVFVDGCATGDTLIPCSPAGVVVITTGDGSPQRRIDEAAAVTMTRVGWLGVASWLVLLWVARLVKARPLASSLIDRFSVPAPKRAWIAGSLIAAAALVFVLGLAFGGCDAPPRSDLGVSRAGHGVGVVMLAVFAITLIVVMQRRRGLADAVRPILAHQTVPLALAGGALVELAVRVHPHAQVQPGPLSGEPRAWWALVVDEEFSKGKSTETRRVQESASQPGVPVIDESGEGMLELPDAKLDVRAVGMSVRAVTWGQDAERIRRILSGLPKADRHVRFIVEERFVEPGESLYVLGHVERVHAAQARAGYRQAPTSAVIRATGESKLFVHAGSERSLLSGIRLEEALASAMVWMMGGLAVLMAGAQIWLVTR